MGRLKLALLIASVAIIVNSLVPVLALYVSPSPVPYSNRQAIDKLVSNRGGYYEFIALADNHAGLIMNDSATLKLIRNINREDRFRKAPIDFVLIGGDITFRGSSWDYRIFNKIRSRLKFPVIGLMGNHDNDNGGLERFKRYVGETEFTFQDRNSYFIVMDTTENEFTEAQFIKFEDELKKSEAYKHRFVAVHKSPLSPYQQSWYRPELNPWSYRFMKLCEKYKVDIVLSGHTHMFKEGLFGGVRYITSGGGGMITTIPRYDGGIIHYIVVRVYGDYVDYEKRDIYPPIWEFVAYYLWKDIFYYLRNVFI